MNRRPPKNGTVRPVIINTLLVDGNSLFKTGFFGAKDAYNDKGNHIGGIYQFITVLRKLLTENLYHNVYVFWDGDFSGKLRYELYKDYKSGRGKDYINGTRPDDVNEVYQRLKTRNYLQELFIRQLSDEIVESDDFIAYYCLKQFDENITICTNDRDMLQLLSPNVKIYFCDPSIKQYVDIDNYKQYFKFHIDNSVLIKTIIGDTSDSIRGVKGVKEKTLLTNFPELSEIKLSIDDIIEKAKILQLNRINNKQKPLQALTNIIEGITTDTNGIPIIKGMDLYKLNYKLVNLKVPMINYEGIEKLENLINSTLSTDDRGIKNAYILMKSDGIDKILGEDRFSEYLMPFKKLMEREIKKTITI